MATTLSLDNEDKMANAILDMIRLQSFDVKRKIQRILAKEIAEEQKNQEAQSASHQHALAFKQLRGILADDGKSYEEMRKDSLKEKYGL